MSKSSIVITALIVLLLSACMSYTDPRVKNSPVSQIAVVEVDISLSVLEIDDQRGPPSWLTSFDELKVPPGKRTFKVIWSNVDIKTEPLTVTAELEAGQTYTLYRVMNFENRTWSAKLDKK